MIPLRSLLWSALTLLIALHALGSAPAAGQPRETFVANGDKILRVDLATGTVLGALIDPENVPADAAFAGVVWRDLLVAPDPTAAVEAFVANRTPQLVIACTAGARIVRIDPTTALWQLIYNPTSGPLTSCRGLAIDTSGKLLVAGDGTGNVAVWQIADATGTAGSPQPLFLANEVGGAARGMAFCRTNLLAGDLLIAGGDDRVYRAFHDFDGTIGSPGYGPFAFSAAYPGLFGITCRSDGYPWIGRRRGITGLDLDGSERVASCGRFRNNATLHQLSRRDFVAATGDVYAENLLVSLGEPNKGLVVEVDPATCSTTNKLELRRRDGFAPVVRAARPEAEPKSLTKTFDYTADGELQLFNLGNMFVEIGADTCTAQVTSFPISEAVALDFTDPDNIFANASDDEFGPEDTLTASAPLGDPWYRLLQLTDVGGTCVGPPAFEGLYRIAVRHFEARRFTRNPRELFAPAVDEDREAGEGYWPGCADPCITIEQIWHWSNFDATAGGDGSRDGNRGRFSYTMPATLSTSGQNEELNQTPAFFCGLESPVAPTDTCAQAAANTVSSTDTLPLKTVLAEILAGDITSVPYKRAQRCAEGPYVQFAQIRPSLTRLGDDCREDNGELVIDNPSSDRVFAIPSGSSAPGAPPTFENPSGNDIKYNFNLNLNATLQQLPPARRTGIFEISLLAVTDNFPYLEFDDPDVAAGLLPTVYYIKVVEP